MPSQTLSFRKRENIIDTLNVHAREEVDDAIAQLVFAHGLPFHIAHSPYFKESQNSLPPLETLVDSFKAPKRKHQAAKHPNLPKDTRDSNRFEPLTFDQPQKSPIPSIPTQVS